MKRRAAIEPVIGHLKAEHRMGRNHLKGREGDRINAVLAAVGYNFFSSCGGGRQRFCTPLF
jgi:IS5 family transposase